MDRFSDALKEICEQLYDVGALKFGDFKMKVGINSPVYFDLRVIVSHPPLMEKLSHLLWEYTESVGVETNLICGVPYTALPISTIVSIKSSIPMLIRRKEPKKYGTMKLIEGTYSAGQVCCIIEDVVTSGCSILETVNDLRHDGLVVKDAIVVIDREQGGNVNLENNGIRMHSLLTLSKALEILHSIGKIDQGTIDSVHKYIRENQILPNGCPMPQCLPRDRRQQSYGVRASVSPCQFSQRLFKLMETKRSNLCVAIDVSNSKELLRLVDAVGSHAAVIKTHYDAIADWNENTENELISLARKHNFCILEDRKYSDIGNTVKLQMESIKRWADAVTMHSIAGPSIIPATMKPIFLIAQMSSSDNLISDSYTQATVAIAEEHVKNVAGLVCQDGNIIKSPGLIQLTPGVAIQKGSDSLGQQYVTPEDAVLTKGGDLIVVGRAIITSSNPGVTANELKETLWSAYERRIS